MPASSKVDSLSVTEARANLPLVVRLAAEGDVYTIGSHRRADAALVSAQRFFELDEMAALAPTRAVLDALAAMAVAAESERIVRSDRWHVSAQFSTTLVWLWRVDSALAVEVALDLVGQVLDLAKPRARVGRVAAAVEGVAAAVRGLPDADAKAVVSRVADTFQLTAVS